MATVNDGFSDDDHRPPLQLCASPIGIYEDPNSLPAVPTHQFAKGMTNIPGEDNPGITLQSFKTTHFYDTIGYCAEEERRCPVMEVENPQYEYGGASDVLNFDIERGSQSSKKDNCFRVNSRWILIGSFLIGCVILLVIAVVSLSSTRTESVQNKLG